MTTMLEARGLAVAYGSVQVLWDVDLEIEAGEMVTLLGPNGAGKSTTILTLAGELVPQAGQVLVGGSATREPLYRRARAGLGLVSEQRSLWPGLSVTDTFRVGRCDQALALDLFPELEPLLAIKVGSLSGGQQQMLAVARALSRRPKALLADELSLGLAPMIVDRLLSQLRKAADDGAAVLFVEQHVHKALQYADRAYVMQRGRIAASGSVEEMRRRIPEIEASYLSDPHPAA